MATPAIEKLKTTRWYKAAAARYVAHCEACAKLEVPPEHFETFAVEVLNAPADKRDWLLAFEPIGNYEPFVRFAQYTTPRQEDMVSGLFYRDYRKGKK